MAVDIHKLIAVICPDIYCSNDMIKDPVTGIEKPSRELVKEAVKKGIAKYNSDLKLLRQKKIDEKDFHMYLNDKFYIDAVKYAIPKKYEAIDFGDIIFRNAANPDHSKTKGLLDSPIEVHKCSYDNFNESLETSYFSILATLNNLGLGKQVKVVDNFMSSPGSGHFSEMGQKATRMQEEAMKMLGATNQVVKSILNLIYDLKEFKIRLGLYQKLNSTNESEKIAAMFSLKQVWLDTVDAKRGNSSIKAMALTQANFVTLIDAFMAVKDESLKDETGTEIDLNERVKRILKQRVLEFQMWVRESERELRKRFDLEKMYLRSQYNTVLLYARWIKPYLLAAKKLEQNASDRATIVNMFNSTLLELVVLAKGGAYDPDDDVVKGDMPKLFRQKQYKDYAAKKGFTHFEIVEFTYTSYPERANNAYGFRGKVEVTFWGYALSSDELKTLEAELQKDDIDDVFGWIERSTGQSLGTLRQDINLLLADDEDPLKRSDEGSTKKEESIWDIFTSVFKTEPAKPKDKLEKKGLPEDGYLDKMLRAQSILTARSRAAKSFELYKKSKQMPTFAPQEDAF
jgi:hypothetical protein